MNAGTKVKAIEVGDRVRVTKGVHASMVGEVIAVEACRRRGRVLTIMLGWAAEIEVEALKCEIAKD